MRMRVPLVLTLLLPVDPGAALALRLLHGSPFALIRAALSWGAIRLVRRLEALLGPIRRVLILALDHRQFVGSRQGLSLVFGDDITA